jgi:hypothetical protein
MTLSTILAIYLGVIIEALWLWQTAGEKYAPSKRSKFKAPGTSTTMTAIGITGTVGLILIGISEAIGDTTVTRYLHSQLEVILMGLAMFFILIVGAVGGWLLPRVNEYNIVAVLAIVTVNTITRGFLTDPLLITATIGLPLLLAAALALQQSPPSLASKLLLYVLYVGALIVLTFQGNILEMLAQTRFTLPEAFLFGSTFTFLSLHTLFGVRFFAIALSMLIPGNRIYAQPMMSKLFRDEQLSPLAFFFTLGMIVAAVLLNHRFALFPEDTFAGVIVILSTQLLFRSKSTSEIV